jgi:hypothetical protein
MGGAGFLFDSRMEVAMSYRRLPGNSPRLSFHRSSLWQGEDHLLLVKKRGYAEEYKRFYYRDIQAIIFTRTNREILNSAILAIFAVFPILLFLAGLVRHWSKAALISWGAIAGFLFLLLVVNRLQGPTCRAEIQTAVQIEMVTSLARVSAARKTMALILPVIEAAQGSFEGSPQQIGT